MQEKNIEKILVFFHTIWYNVLCQFVILSVLRTALSKNSFRGGGVVSWQSVIFAERALRSVITCRTPTVKPIEPGSPISAVSRRSSAATPRRCMSVPVACVRARSSAPDSLPVPSLSGAGLPICVGRAPVRKTVYAPGPHRLSGTVFLFFLSCFSLCAALPIFRHACPSCALLCVLLRPLFSPLPICTE